MKRPISPPAEPYVEKEYDHTGNTDTGVEDKDAFDGTWIRRPKTETDGWLRTRKGKERTYPMKYQYPGGRYKLYDM